LEFNRHILKDLFRWKTDTPRKPLILRGARQVGKTTIVRQFANSYKQFIYLNLEKSEDRKYFENFDDVLKISTSIFLDKGLKEDWGNTLLFIDEIQESPIAIQLLRYFYEELSELHVIAAGSLLEFALGDVKSFPVGRVSYLYLFPFNFEEFLEASNKTRLVDELNNIPVNDFAHHSLIKQFHEYALIGGMPEVVQRYMAEKKLIGLSAIYESIWGTYKDDVKKYAKNETEKKVIELILSTAAQQLDQRVKFQNFGNSNYKSREVGEALRRLDDARVIQLIYPTTDLTFPIKPDFKKPPRLQFLDTGLVNHILAIQSEMLAMEDLNQAYKGALIPHLVTQELMSINTISSKKPNFWVREKSQSSAEVDLVVSYKSMIIPIEIKSGKTGKLKSLHQFIDKTNHPYAVRMYAGEFKIEQHTTQFGTPYLLMNLPYYLGTKIHDYIDYFVKNHALSKS
jgi:predicted AAA+ superfamily ATPase